jgi:5-methylcytosine-specific restriction endonuclease McrA
LTLRNLTDDQLVFEAREAVKVEREATSVVVKYLREIHDRELYLKVGCASLFQFAVEKLGYCPSSAHARISAMELVAALPQVEKKIESGELSLTAAAKVQTFFRAEKKAKKSYSTSQKLEVIEECLSKSTREVERELAKRNPEVLRYELSKPVGEDRIQLTFTITRELEAKILKLKGLLAHRAANLNYEELFEILVELGLDKLDPVRKAEKDKRRAQKTDQSEYDSFRAHETGGHRSRYIRAQDRHEVWAKNGGRGCEYIDRETGRVCGSQHALQIDHQEGFAIGGTNHAHNLRILCAKHNRFVWKQKTGRVRQRTLPYLVS